MSNNDQVLTTKDVAKLLGLSEGTIRKYTREGRLVARYKVGKKKYHIHDVQAFRRGIIAKTPAELKSKNFSKIK